MGKIFVSYRRDDSDFAHRIADKLDHHLSANIFVDIKIRSADWVEALEQEIHECNVFLLCVTTNTFNADRIISDEDWIRREIALALTLNKPIVLALKEGLAPPSPEILPENIQSIVTRQGIPFYASYFNDGIDNLAEHCIAISGGSLQKKSDSNIKLNEERPHISSTATGDGNIQFTGSTFSSPVAINTGASKRQEQLARLQYLEQQESKLQNKISRTSQSSSKSMTTEGILGRVTMIIFIGFIIATVTHPIFGIAVVGAIGYWIFTKYSTESDSKNAQLYQLKQDLNNIRKEISINKEQKHG
jgi:cell division protein FtsB